MDGFIMFELIKLAPIDPILGILDLFCNDFRKDKLNFGIGVYQDHSGNVPILKCVKKAEFILLNNESTKNYLNIEGMSDFIYHTQCLLFNKDNEIIKDKRVMTAQTPGGTGAIRVAIDFLVKNTPIRRIWISNPTWVNHVNICNALGLQIYSYPYHKNSIGELNFDSIIQSLNKATRGDVVLFHGCCHNPTGMDLSYEQWYQLAELSMKNNWLPLFDIAYQGFGVNLDKDVEGLNIFCKFTKELIVCNSYSKNFGLYNERVGSCSIIAADNKIVERSFSQLKCVIRAHYSNPPVHGAKIVSIILNDTNLCSMWKQELHEIRQHIFSNRQLFFNTLQSLDQTRDFSFILKQYGMFSCIDFNKDQVFKIRNDLGIYMAECGRINIAGITPENVLILCRAIISVL